MNISLLSRPLLSHSGRNVRPSLLKHKLAVHLPALPARTLATKVQKQDNSPPPRPSILSRFLPTPSSQNDEPPSTSIKSLFALAAPERRPLTLGVGLLLISSSISLSVPFTIGRLIDYFSSNSQNLVLTFPPTLVDYLSLPVQLELPPALAGGILFSLFTLGAVSNAGRSFLFRISGQRIVQRLRQHTYDRALRQEVEFVEKGEGDIVSRLSVDSTIVGEAVTSNVSDGLRAIVTATVGLGAMFYLSPQLTLLMLALVPPISLGAVMYGRYLKRLSTATQEAVGAMSETASESLNSLRTVQAYTASDYESNRFGEKLSVILSLARKEAVASAAFFGTTGWSGNMALLCLLGYGGSLVSQGVISVGDLTSLLLYSVYVGGSLQNLTSFFSSIMRAVGASTRIFTLIDREPLIKSSEPNAISVDPSRRGVLKFENIYFHYPSRSDVPVLKDFNLEVNVGESVAVVGLSGSGKSSVHALLLRYYDPVGGVVKYDGQDLREFTTDSWRKLIGVVPQDPVLFAGTIASNIAYGMSNVSQSDIESAAHMANCDFVWDLPMGFQTKIGKMSLSGGQRQRLAIARALLKKPAILALDEATSALDAGSEMRVNDAIDKILSDSSTTCLIVAHRLSTIARAERVVVLEDGRITESGSYKQLAANRDSRFYKLMAAQLEAAVTDEATSDGLK